MRHNTGDEDLRELERRAMTDDRAALRLLAEWERRGLVSYDQYIDVSAKIDHTIFGRVDTTITFREISEVRNLVGFDIIFRDIPRGVRGRGIKVTGSWSSAETLLAVIERFGRIDHWWSVNSVGTSGGGSLDLSTVRWPFWSRPGGSSGDTVVSDMVKDVLNSLWIGEEPSLFRKPLLKALFEYRIGCGVSEIAALKRRAADIEEETIGDLRSELLRRAGQYVVRKPYVEGEEPEPDEEADE